MGHLVHATGSQAILPESWTHIYQRVEPMKQGMRETVHAQLILVKETKPDTSLSKQQREDSTGHPTLTGMRIPDSAGDRASGIGKSHPMMLNFQPVTSVLH